MYSNLLLNLTAFYTCFQIKNLLKHVDYISNNLKLLYFYICQCKTRDRKLIEISLIPNRKRSTESVTQRKQCFWLFYHIIIHSHRLEMIKKLVYETIEIIEGKRKFAKSTKSLHFYQLNYRFSATTLPKTTISAASTTKNLFQLRLVMDPLANNGMPALCQDS